MFRRLISFFVTSGAFFLLGLLSLSFTSSYTGAHDDADRIFFIARSKNANIVCYDLKTDKRGNIDEKEPLKVYWINKTDHPGEVSELSYIQNKMAYGYSSKALGKGIYEISLVAFPSRKLLITRNEKGKYQGRMVIGGQQAVLTKIFVQAKPESFLKVAWIELTGTSLEGGKVLSERIVPN